MTKKAKVIKTLDDHHSHKCPTGIKGFDQITEGGLPKNRITLISGSAGSGKTLLGIDFLIKGAIHYKELGICMSFEETASSGMFWGFFIERDRGLIHPGGKRCPS